MKKPLLFKIFLICLSFGFIACSSDDSTDDNPTPTPTEGNFTKRLLVEDFTGTWCANCPNVAHAIELLKEESPNQIVAVGIHRESSDPTSPNYDPFNFDATELQNEYGIYGTYPSALLNRVTQWTYPVLNNLDQAKALLNQSSSIGLAINPSIDGSNLNIDLSTKFGADFSSQNLKLVIYVLESGLIYNQVNGTPHYNGVDPIVDFKYDHVLRTSLTDLLGDAIPAEETSLGTVYTKNISVPVSETDVTDAANISVVAFVIDSNGNALNVRKAHVGETQTFEEN